MRRAWPSLLTAIGGLLPVLVGVGEAREPGNPVYSCDETMDCEVVRVLDGPSVASIGPWFLSGAIAFGGAALVFRARKP